MMAWIDHIARVIQSGGCVVMGVGVAPERYRALLQGISNQDYILIAPKDSTDANFIASRINGEPLQPNPLSILGLKMDVYQIKGEEPVG
jgi:hypothetical protein